MVSRWISIGVYLRTKSKAHTKMWPTLTILNVSLELYSEKQSIRVCLIYDNGVYWKRFMIFRIEELNLLPIWWLKKTHSSLNISTLKYLKILTYLLVIGDL